jgi:hypothetical protein
MTHDLPINVRIALLREDRLLGLAKRRELDALLLHAPRRRIGGRRRQRCADPLMNWLGWSRYELVARKAKTP